MTARSLSFDRVAADYDSTRAISPAAERATVALLGEELRDRQPCLEVGVGTGRLALPLQRAGPAMAGVDLSGPMLARLVAKAGGTPPFPLARADAVALPFVDDCFGSVVCAWVLHLVPRWRDALAELVRVVRPGGVVLITLGNFGRSLWREVQERFLAAAGVAMRHAGVDDWDEVEAAMAALGGRVRRLPYIEDERRRSIEEMIALLESGTFSFTWELDDGIRRAAARQTRAWARSALGDLAATRSVAVPMEWRAFDV